MAFTPFLNDDTRSTSLANLIRCTLDDCHRDFESLLSQAVSGDDESRERALLRFTHAARQRLLRLRVIVGHGTRVRHRAGCRSLQWLSSLKVHDAVLQNAPQKLFEEHQRLAIFVPVPIFDVSTALTVFARGFMPLPGFIGEFNQAPTRPSGRKRRLLVAQANSLVYRLLHQSRWPKGLKLIQVEDIKAILGSDSGYEVALLLEPAPPAPLDAITDDVLQLVNEPRVSGATEAESKAAAAAANASGADAKDAAPAVAAEPQASREEVAAHLEALGFTEAAFPAQQPQWRWRIVNVAVSAGSGGGHRMSKQQLQFLRTDLDYRMLHVRHAAMTHHLARLVRARAAGDAPAAAADTTAGPAAVATASVGPSASQATAGTLPDAASIGAAKLSGSAEKCLREEYSSLLEAALSMPLAIMSSMLHDISASLTFNAAAAAARRLQQPPHRWRHHIAVSTRVKCVQMGIRVELWQSAPLTPAAAVEVGPGADAQANSAAAEQPGTLLPAIEVGTLRGSIACCCDPPVAELWAQAGVQEELAVAPREPGVDPVQADLETAMLDLASSCALMQLVMMRKLMERSFLKQGWTCKDLEADLGVTLALPTADGERRGEGRVVQRRADVSLPGAVSVEGVDTLARLKAAVASAGDRGSAAQLDGAAGSSAAQLQPPQTDARPGPTDAGGAGGPPGGRPAHRTFAATASERDAAAARRPVPLLVVRVRGRPAVLVGLDLISGAVHLHAGESSLYGQVFVTALELEAHQTVLRSIQAGNPPSGAVPGMPLEMLSSELSRFLVDRLLVSRASHRAAAARSLWLLPLKPTQRCGPDDGTGWQPFGRRLLEVYFASFPAMRARFPVHACFLAMPASPPSLPLWVTHVRSRGLRSSDTAAMPRSVWPRMQFTIAVGLDSAGLVLEEPEEPGTPPGAPPGTRPPKRVRTRMCSALVCALMTPSSGTQVITHVEPVPPQVFTGAQRLLDEGTSAEAVLAAVGRHSRTEAGGWFRWPEDGAAGGAGGGGHGRGQKRPRSSDGGAAHANGEDTNGAVRKQARGDGGGVTPGAVSVGGTRPVSGDAVTPEAEREGMEVALMVGFLSTRALVCYLRAELDAIQASFSEAEPLSGSLNPLASAPLQPTLQLQSLPYDSSGTSYTFPEKPVPWPLCVPRDGPACRAAGGALPEDASVSQVTVVVLSPAEWELHVESRYMAAMLGALQSGPAGAEHLPPIGKWRLHPLRPLVVVSRYSTQRSGRAAMHCWRDVLALLRTRDTLAALAIVHRPVNGSAGGGASTGGGVQPLRFPFTGYDAVAEAVALDRIRVAVERTKVGHVALTPPPADVATGVAILTLDIVCEWDHRVEARLEAPPDGGAPRHKHHIMLFVTSKAVVVSVAGGAPPPPGLQEKLTEILWTTVLRLDMSSFLDALVTTAEGGVELLRVVGAGAVAAAGLEYVKRVEVMVATAPTRLVVMLQSSTAAEPYAVGVLLKKQGLAMLHFDPRQFATQAEMGHSMTSKRGSGDRRPRTLVEVPEWATIAGNLLSGENAVGRAAADVHVAWEADDPNGANIAVPQRLLGDVVMRIAKFLDAALRGHG